MVNVDLYSAIITKVSNVLNTQVSGEKPDFQALSKGLIVLLCAESSGKELQITNSAGFLECSSSIIKHFISINRSLIIVAGSGVQTPRRMQCLLMNVTIIGVT